MTKEEAVSEIFEHLSMLEDYGVLDSNTAGMLYQYTSGIVLAIDNEDEEAKTKAKVIQILNTWDSYKRDNNGDDFGKPRGNREQ